MSSEKPLVYLILGAAGSGRREIVADLIDGGLAAGSAGQPFDLAQSRQRARCTPCIARPRFICRPVVLRPNRGEA